MRRVTLMLVAMAVMVPLFAVVAYAAAGGNAANAAKCEEGGYLDYTDANGNPFKNEGQCTRYAAKGGQLVPIPDISLDPAAGTISGTGFTPNSLIVLVVNISWPSGGSASNIPLSTDENGAFVASGFNFCPTSSDTFVAVRVTDGGTTTLASESTGVDCG
jgi:hypothetical protein